MPIALHPDYSYLPFPGRTSYSNNEELWKQVQRNVDAAADRNRASAGTLDSQRELMELIQPLLEEYDSWLRWSEQQMRNLRFDNP